MFGNFIENEKSCFICTHKTNEFICLECSRQLSYYQELRGRSSYRDIRLFFTSPYFSRYKHMVWDLKFRKRTYLARGFAYLMAEAYLSLARSIPDLIVPMPLGAFKERQRGFNQSGILAEELGKILSVRKGDLLIKKDTRPLSQSNGYDREMLIKHSMGIAKGFSGFRGKLLVVDDVFTTGATMREAARVLVENGYTEIDFLFFARQEIFDNLKIWFP